MRNRSQALESLETRIGRVGQRLNESLNDLLAVLRGGQARPSDLCRDLGIKKDLSTRLLKATRSSDPLSTLHLIPGPEALRILLKATRRRVPSPLHVAAERAVNDFDELMRELAGDRTGLEAILSRWLPNARSRFEMSNKQAAFKAIANLKGFAADVSVYAYFVVPGELDDRCELATVQGCVGLRRLRPQTPIHVTNFMSGPGAQEVEFLTFDGQPVAAYPSRTLLGQFCSLEESDMEVRLMGGHVQYSLLGEGVGLASATDVFFGDRVTNILRRWRSSEGRKVAVGPAIEVPSRVLLFDVLIHREVWRDAVPDLRIYDTTILGLANPNDSSRDADQLSLREEIEMLGDSMSFCRSDEVPAYTEILRYACTACGWSPDSFRAYRCRVQYPLYGSEFCMLFDPPERPAAIS